MALAIVNRDPRDPHLPTGLPTWRTCLRAVAFSDDADDMEAPAPDRRLIEGEAYGLLLEILCGLQSPLVGETQVMGQFKTFLASLGREHGWLHRLGQRLLTDAREIRAHHLQGLGSRSYGSAVRRLAGQPDVTAIVGTGALAEEVLPFLAGPGRRVDWWGRRDLAGPVPAGARYLKLDSLDDFIGPIRTTILVVAAPIPSELVRRLSLRYPRLERVIDLRGEADQPLSLPVPVTTLDQVFQQMTQATQSASAQLDAARAEIAARSRQYELRDELHPFGWDDLCA